MVGKLTKVKYHELSPVMVIVLTLIPHHGTCQHSQPNYPPVSHFLKRELLQIMPVVGGYIALQAREM